MPKILKILKVYLPKRILKKMLNTENYSLNKKRAKVFPFFRAGRIWSFGLAIIYRNAVKPILFELFTQVLGKLTLNLLY